MNPDFIESRTKKLQEFLDQLMKNEVIGASHFLGKWLRTSRKNYYPFMSFSSGWENPTCRAQYKKGWKYHSGFLYHQDEVLSGAWPTGVFVRAAMCIEEVPNSGDSSSEIADMYKALVVSKAFKYMSKATILDDTTVTVSPGYLARQIFFTARIKMMLPNGEPGKINFKFATVIVTINGTTYYLKYAASLEKFAEYYEDAALFFHSFEVINKASQQNNIYRTVINKSKIYFEVGPAKSQIIFEKMSYKFTLKNLIPEDYWDSYHAVTWIEAANQQMTDFRKRMGTLTTLFVPSQSKKLYQLPWCQFDGFLFEVRFKHETPGFSVSLGAIYFVYKLY